jgi:flavin reductase (DIM6/NTAB) family NADH-FMN oxidoreductase RutF
MTIAESETPQEEIDRVLFRAVMGRFATGVTVITTRFGDQVRGMTANAFMSGSLSPPLCVISIAKRAHMHNVLLESGRFAVNVLTEHQEALAPHFAGKPDAGMDVPFRDVDGIPTLTDFCACITADTVSIYECGDHTIFVGHIRHMEAQSRPPLLYHAGHYGKLIEGKVEADFFPITEFW